MFSFLIDFSQFVFFLDLAHAIPPIRLRFAALNPPLPQPADSPNRTIRTEPTNSRVHSLQRDRAWTPLLP